MMQLSTCHVRNELHSLPAATCMTKALMQNWSFLTEDMSTSVLNITLGGILAGNVLLNRQEQSVLNLLSYVSVGLCSHPASSASAVFCVSLCCWVGSLTFVCLSVSCLLSCHFVPFPSGRASLCNIRTELSRYAGKVEPTSHWLPQGVQRVVRIHCEPQPNPTLPHIHLYSSRSFTYIDQRRVELWFGC
jgi:hypothetical protein